MKISTYSVIYFIKEVITVNKFMMILLLSDIVDFIEVMIILAIFTAMFMKLVTDIRKEIRKWNKERDSD